MEFNFQNVTAKRKAPCWNHFKLDEEQEMAVCLHCKIHLKSIGGSTNGLNKHMKRKHQEIDMNPNTEEEIEIKPSSSKQWTLFDCNENTKKSKQQLVSELAMDGISLNVISSSQTLYDLAKPEYELPRSATTVKSWILQYSNEKKSKLIETIKDLKENNERFAISLDGMAICVVKFPRKGYKVIYIFGQKSTYNSCRIFLLFFHFYPVLEHFILF